MKRLAKSILNPFRATRCGGGGGVSFSFLRRPCCSSNGGQGQEPHSSSSSKKRGSVFENHEPSSPKVTCIGQVRVKSKRNGKKSRKRKTNGEVSFRKINEQCNGSGSQECRNQRWVLLPISVCEALRGFGAEFSCLFPCKSSCFSRRNNKIKKNENGCGVVFPRWLVAVEDGSGGRRREVEVVVGGGAEEEVVERRPSIRRHVFEDSEVKDDGNEDEEEQARVSICIPPKNALLLMRCRSDPMKMASFENHRFSWDGNAAPRYENGGNYCIDFEKQHEEDGEKKQENEVLEQEINGGEELVTKNEEQEQEQEQEQEEVESNMSSFEALLDQENGEDYQDCSIQEKEEHHEQETGESKTHQENQKQESVPQTKLESKNQENESPLLPECLLLMMCEPKLSMEVSKETWVRGADFIRWLPERPRKAAKAAAKTGGCDHELVKKRPNVEAKIKPNVPAPPARKNEHLPPRSSCSLPAAVVAAAAVEGVTQEPVGLTRCKSEPMRTAAAKLMPESCGMKIESQSKSAVGVDVGAAGVGF